jgi:hypothetical protein
MREVVKGLEPVLGMDDFFPAGPFMFAISVAEDKVEVEEKPQHQSNASMGMAWLKRQARLWHDTLSS